MARSKEEDKITISLVFPERYGDYEWKVECSKDTLTVLDNFEMNVNKKDKKYELLTLIESENRQSASKMIKSHKNYTWKKYFMYSPYLRIFGMRNPTVDLPRLEEMMHNMIAIFMLADEYIIGGEEIEYETYSALAKIINQYDAKIESQEESVAQKNHLTWQEKRALSEEILGYNIWHDPADVFDFPEMINLNYEFIGKRIWDIVTKYKDKCSGPVEIDEAEIKFSGINNTVLEIPVYLSPIMKTISNSHKYIPWMFGKKGENIFDKFTYTCRPSKYIDNEIWKTMEILKRLLDWQKIDCFEEEGFLENYYRFIYCTFKKAEDAVNETYLVYYAMEKIYALELFELETDYILEHFKENMDVLDEKKTMLRHYLNMIFNVNGVWTRLELAECFLKEFFNKEISDDFKGEIDSILEEHKSGYILLRKDESFNKKELYDEVKKSVQCGRNERCAEDSECREQKKCEWSWYVKRHKGALAPNDEEKWYKEYLPQGERAAMMLRVMKASIGHSLDFGIDMEGEDGRWNETCCRDYLCGVDDEE